MPTQYELVSSSNPDALSRTVDELLNDGWQLYGSPAVSPAVPPGCPTYVQALIKYLSIKPNSEIDQKTRPKDPPAQNEIEAPPRPKVKPVDQYTSLLASDLLNRLDLSSNPMSHPFQIVFDWLKTVNLPGKGL